MTNIILEDAKKSFLRDEMCMLSIGVVIQRANVYLPGVEDDTKRLFKSVLKEELLMMAGMYHISPVSEYTHIRNIERLSEFSTGFSKFLRNGSLHFGICQRMLNLFLKYAWCSGAMKEAPPHFPIGHTIQQQLGYPEKEIIQWANNLTRESYLEIINFARTRLETMQVNSLAELDLLLYKKV